MTASVWLSASCTGRTWKRSNNAVRHVCFPRPCGDNDNDDDTLSEGHPTRVARQGTQSNKLVGETQNHRHVEGNGEQKSDNSVQAGRTYRDRNILQILKGDAGEFSLFVDLENMGTTFQHQLKNGHREPGKIVNDTYSGVVPVEDECSLDPWCVLSMLGGELVGRTPEKSRFLI